jgi:hypothetical protein
METTMHRLTRLAALLSFSALALAPITAFGQAPYPPNTFHPYRGGTNCIQVADAAGNFNCAGGTKVDPATGNMIVSGTLAFTGLAAGTFSNGLALAAVNSGVQLLGAGDFVISTSPSTIASSGPLMPGVVFRVRRVGAGQCQIVVSGGTSFKEFVIPVTDPTANVFMPTSDQTQLLMAFPGGPSGC